MSHYSERKLSDRIDPLNLYRLRKSDIDEIKDGIKKSKAIANDVALNFAKLLNGIKNCKDIVELDHVTGLTLQLDMANVWNKKSIKVFMDTFDATADRYMLLQAVTDGMSKKYS